MRYKLTDKIIIRPLTSDDVVSNYYEKWMYDPEVTKYNSHGLFPQTLKERDSFAECLDSNKNSIHWAICEINGTLYDKNFHIGNVSLQRINLIYQSSELAIVIGEKEYWGKGIGYLACKAVLDHGFKRLNLNRIWTGTAENNIGMNKICEKLGMEIESVFKAAMFLNGKFVNINQYVIFQEDWLKNKL